MEVRPGVPEVPDKPETEVEKFAEYTMLPFNNTLFVLAYPQRIGRAPPLFGRAGKATGAGFGARPIRLYPEAWFVLLNLQI